MGSAGAIRLLNGKAINIQKLKSGSIKPLTQNRSESLEQLVAKIVILFAFCAKTLSVERDRSRHLNRSRIEAPMIRRDQPGPTENLAVFQSLNCQAAATRRENFEGDLSLTNQE